MRPVELAGHARVHHVDLPAQVAVGVALLRESSWLRVKSGCLVRSYLVVHHVWRVVCDGPVQVDGRRVRFVTGQVQRLHVVLELGDLVRPVHGAVLPLAVATSCRVWTMYLSWRQVLRSTYQPLVRGSRPCQNRPRRRPSHVFAAHRSVDRIHLRWSP